MAKRRAEIETPASSSEKTTWRGWSFSSREGLTTIFKRHTNDGLEKQQVDFSLLSQKATAQLRPALELWFELKLGFRGDPTELQALIDEARLINRPFPLHTATQFFSEISQGNPEIFDEHITGTLSQVVWGNVFGTKQLLASMDYLTRLPADQSEAASREFARLYSLLHDGIHAAARKILLERHKLGLHKLVPPVGVYSIQADGIQISLRSNAFAYPGEATIVEPVLDSIVKSLRRLSGLTGRGFNQQVAKQIVVQLMENDFSTGLALYAFDIDRVSTPGEDMPSIQGKVGNHRSIIQTYVGDVALSDFQHEITVFKTSSGKKIQLGQVGRCPHPTNSRFR